MPEAIQKEEEKDEKEVGRLSDDDLIKLAKKRYKRGLDANSHNRQAFKEDVEFAYYPYNQWPEDVRKMRESQGQQCVEVNRIPAFIRSVTNDIRQNRPSIKVRPVDNEADVETADILSGIIRHIESNSAADIAYDNAAHYAVSGGFGFIRIITDYVPGTFDQDIYIKPIANPLSVVYDCDAVGLDGSDWTWCFVADEMPLEEFKHDYPDVNPSEWETPDAEGWHDAEKVRIAEYFWIEKDLEPIYLMKDGTIMEDESWIKAGKPNYIDKREVEMPCVYWAKIGGDSVLERGEIPGNMIPVVAVFGDQVTIDNKRYLLSIHRYAKDAQRMLNYFRSTEANLLSLAPISPFIAAEGQTEDFPEWDTANTANHAVMRYKQTDVEGRPAPAPQRQPFSPPPSGVLQGAINASMDMMDITGIHESNLGQKSNEQSGRAIVARQREGDTATFHFVDNQTRAIRVVGKVLIGMIPQVYDAKRIMRLKDENENEQEYTINAKIKEKDEYGRDVEKIYDVTLGTYDVSVAAGASFGSRRQEATEAMTQLFQSDPALMGVIGDIFLRNQDWPGAQEAADRIKKTLDPKIVPPEQGEDAPQMPPEVQAQIQQMQQQMQAMDQALQQAAQSHQELQAQLEDKQAELAIKAKEVQVKEMDAETKRLAVVLPYQQEPAAPELSDADKLEIQIAKDKHDAEMQRQHDVRMANIHHAHSKMGDNAMTLCDENGDEMPSELAQMMMAIVQSQQQAAALLQQNTEQTAQLAAIIAAPKEVIRDADGRPVGVRPVL